MGAQLSIGRFVTTTARDDERRVARLAESVARHDLARALADAELPGGIWCLRRLDVQVDLDLEDADLALGRAWADALVARLLQALAGTDPEVVHYDGPVQALADLIASNSLGRPRRAWAWTQAGVRVRGDPDPASSPGEAIVVALRRHHGPSSRIGLPAVIAAVRSAGLAALHRVLGGSGPRARGGGWAAVADLLAPVGTTDMPSGWREPASPRVPAPGTDRADGVLVTAAWDARDPRESVAARRLLAKELLGRSTLGAAIIRSRLRPDEVDARAWAALMVAESDPSALDRPDADRLLRELTALVRAPGAVESTSSGLAGAVEAAQPLGTTTPAPEPVSASASSPAAASTASPTIADTADDRPDRPRRADDDGDVAAADGDSSGPVAQVAQTEWGGLLFLLSLAPAVGLPHVVIADAGLGSRSLRWVLQAVAVRLLPLSEDDPALAAFAGLGPAAPSPWFTGSASTAVERQSVRRLGDRWARAVTEALGCPDADAAATVRAMSSRRGSVVFRPGWIEVVLALDEVDVEVRVAGLDLDPGWVPWLGCVLRFRYE